MIARDTGPTVKVGLEVYHKDGRKVGYVDQVSDAQGWMQVEGLGPRPAKALDLIRTSSVYVKNAVVTAAMLRRSWLEPADDVDATVARLMVDAEPGARLASFHEMRSRRTAPQRRGS